MAVVSKNDLILFFLVLILLGMPCFSNALSIQHEDGDVLPLSVGEVSLDPIDFSEISESALLNDENFGQTTEKNNKSIDSMSNKGNHFLNEINDEYELKQIRQELLKGEYGKVKSENARNRISNRNIPLEKVDFNIDSLNEDFDVEQTVEKGVDKVKNKVNNLMTLSEQPDKFVTKNSVSDNVDKEKKYLQDDTFSREIFNETFKWTIIYLIIGLISLKILIKAFSAISLNKKKSKRRRRRRRRY